MNKPKKHSSFSKFFQYTYCVFLIGFGLIFLPKHTYPFWHQYTQDTLIATMLSTLSIIVLSFAFASIITYLHKKYPPTQQ